jgi:dTMP kinase
MKYHIQFDLSFVTNTYPGKYFAFEGIDGSGKTTQVHNLAAYFQNQGKEVLITKEPTNNIIGTLIKKVIHEEEKMPSMSLQHLFAADRALHLEQDVIPALQMGKVVISDRSLWSAVAYGISDLKLSENEKERELLVHNVLAMYGGYLIPDKTFVIAVPAQIAIDRIVQRGEETTLYEKTEILSRVEKEYEWMGQKFSDVLKIIDGTKSVENVFQQIVESIK